MKVLYRDIRSGKRKLAILDLESTCRQAMDGAMEQVKDALVTSHEMIVADWTHRPEFAARKYISGDAIAVAVFPIGENKEIWFYVDQGTEPHNIPLRPKPKGKWLKFEWGGPGSYIPKTLARPARTVSGGGKVAGGRTVYAKIVHHPGSEGREFTRTIAEDIKPEFRRMVENAFRQVAAQVNRD